VVLFPEATQPAWSRGTAEIAIVNYRYSSWAAEKEEAGKKKKKKKHQRISSGSK
jgi:hypothetical protein